MSKLIVSLLVLFAFTFAGAEFGGQNVFAQQKNSVAKRKAKKKIKRRSKSRLARQRPIPILTPSSDLRQVTDSNLPYGKNSTFGDATDGPGMGRGQGTGNGTGSGTGGGQGTGYGPGIGRGSGQGGGSGTGDGGTSPKPPPPAVPDGIKCADGTVSTKFRVTAKPRAPYTEKARQNQIQGVVVLRVTFGGNGQVLGVSVVKGLPDGLTEQAIAAARQMRFIPETKCGVPVTITKPAEYSFTIY